MNLKKMKRLIHRLSIHPVKAGLHPARVHKKNKGITLLEVMVAMTIFSAGFLCLLPMIVTAIKGNEFAEDYTKATSFNQAKAEELKSTHSFLAGDSDGVDTVENMTRTWRVRRDATLTHYYSMTVVTSWYTDDGRAHQCSLYTGESTTE